MATDSDIPATRDGVPWASVTAVLAAVLPGVKLVSVSRAQPPPTSGDVAILVGALGEFPSVSTEEDRRSQEARFEREAGEVTDALCAALPGGTLDRVVAELLAHRVSGLVVARGASREGNRLSGLPGSWQAHELGEIAEALRCAAAQVDPGRGLEGELASRRLLGFSERLERARVARVARGGDGFLTWSDLRRRLDELEKSALPSELAAQVVIRVDDGDELHVGGLRAADVDGGCGDAAVLILDGDHGMP